MTRVIKDFFVLLLCFSIITLSANPASSMIVDNFVLNLDTTNVDGGEAFIQQAGDPTVDLGLANPSVARIFQMGEDNDATINQVGEQSYAFIQQGTETVAGLNNIALINQVSLSNGVGDAILLFQVGNGNEGIFDAYGSSNRILARQVGDENTAQITQGNAGTFSAAHENLALVIQNGNRNAATINQDGNNNEAYVNQSGVTVGPIEGEDVVLLLPSDDNTASITQIGLANKGRIYQAGTFNTASIFQEGDNNRAMINQTGGILEPDEQPAWDITPPAASDFALLGSHMNQGFIEQIGMDNIAGIFQAGENNYASIFQDGIGNEANVVQKGIGNIADISQVGNGNFVNLEQFNNFNSISISQTGSGNVFSVTQRGGEAGGFVNQP